MEVDGGKLCKTCQLDGKSVPAKGFCKDCAEYMCQECFNQHLRARPCRDHVLDKEGSGSMPNPTGLNTEKCKTHLNEDITRYCPRHHVVLCVDCITDEHRECRGKIERISDRAEDYKGHSETNMLQRFEAEFNAYKLRLEDNIKNNESLLEKAKSDIGKFRKEINDYLDVVEEKIVSEANKIFKENIKLMNQTKNLIEQFGNEVHEINASLEARKNQPVKRFVRMVECRPQLTVLGQSLPEIKKKNNIYTFQFEAEHTLQKLLIDTMAFGKMLVLPDPRLAGFDVDARVRYRRYSFIDSWDRWFSKSRKIGTVQSVNTAGFVDVLWDGDTDITKNYKAGFDGEYSLELCNTVDFP